MEHIELEQKVMDMLLDGDDNVLRELRNQFLNSKVDYRDFTGVGFFTGYRIKEDIRSVLNGKNFEIDDVIALHDTLEFPLGFVLFIRKGYLSTLEGYTFGDETWPNDFTNVILKYNTSDGKRDLQELRLAWLK
jgi:hypothetical protein